MTALLTLSACTNDDAVSPDGMMPPTAFDPTLTLTVPDPPGDYTLGGLANSASWSGQEFTPVMFNDLVDEDAGAVLVATTQPAIPEFARRVLVCASKAENGPTLVGDIPGNSVDLGHSTARVSEHHHYGMPTCGAPDREALIWHQNGWLLNATAMDGDLDNAEYVAAAVTISPDGVFDEVSLDEPWSVAGQLDAGWSVPADNAISQFTRVEETVGPYVHTRQFSARIVLADEHQRHAIVARLSTDPDEMVDRVSAVPAYNVDDYSDPTTFSVENTRVTVGAWGPSTVAAVVVPDDAAQPAVAMLVGANTGSSDDDSNFPDPRTLATFAARVRGVDSAERQALIDAAHTVDDSYVDPRFEPPLEGREVPILLHTDDSTFRMLPYIRRQRVWDVGANVATEIEQLLVETGRMYAPDYGVYLNGDRTLQLDAHPIRVATVDVPQRRPTTFEHPTAILPSTPSGQIEVLVLAERGVEIEIEVDDIARQLTMFDIDVVAVSHIPHAATRPYDGGERWGRMVVDAPGGRDSIVIRATRDSEVIHEKTANPFG